MKPIERYRGRFCGFMREILREHYLHGSGKRRTFRGERIYRKYADIFTKRALDTVRRYHERSNTARSRFLEEFAVSGYITRKIAPFTDRVMTVESTATVRFRKEEVPYRYASVLITNEEDRRRRRGLFLARERVTRDEVNPLLRESWTRAHELAKRLGYANYREMCESLSGVDLDRLLRETGRLLSRTEGVYREMMGEALERDIGIPLAEAEKHDVAHMFRAVRFDPMFPKEKCVGAFRRTLRGMGIDLDSQENVILDIEERPTKSPRAFCIPLDPPKQVYLVTMPHGGYDDYRALFHEGGHTEHYAHVDASLEPEFRYLGDNSVTESYAMLMEYLVSRRAWLESTLSPERDLMEAFMRQERLNKIYFLRRYSAKLRYEVELHTKGVRGMRRRYRSHLESALMFRHPENHYLVDLDAEFYSARYLRAWMLERQISAYLEGSFGETWYRSRRAGRFLRGLWSAGQRPTAEDIAERCGYDGLDPDPLIEELTSGI